MTTTFNNLDQITDICVICQEEVTQGLAHPAGAAYHLFHDACVRPWLNGMRPALPAESR